MQTRVVCECGNEVVVSAEQANVEYRCPRCGRRIFVNDEEAKAYFDSHYSVEDHVADDGPIADVPQARTAHHVADHAADSDPEATVVQSVLPQGSAVKKNNIGSGMAGPAVHPDNDEEDFFEVSQQPTNEDSNHLTPGTNPSSLKYDLSQRVMRPISKPALPAVPYMGAGEYGIHRVLRVHQKGGMGRILVAYDQYLKRAVAIKELHPEVADDDSIVRRFIGEAEITAQLEHPGVVPIHRLDQGRDGLPYYTMKMIIGDTLQDAIKAYHRKPAKAELTGLVRRLVSVAKTMSFAHSKGVVHRDLKPANIMLGEHGETLVMDWGLAKLFNQGTDESYVSIVHQSKQSRPDLTMVGAIVGTPAFMSPEQAMAEENVIGPLSDVFSLGTILYYLLAGQTAFSGRSTQDVLSKVRACNPTPPSQIKPNVPRDLEVICLKAMAKLPENRYQGATEFADDLCRWLDDEPLFAASRSVFSKIRRLFGQYHLLLIGLPCVLFLSAALVWFGMESHSSRVGGTSTRIVPVFKEGIHVVGSPGINVWSQHKEKGELSLVCRVLAARADEYHQVSIRASVSGWDLSEQEVLKFYLQEILPDNGALLQNFRVLLRQGESYYEYKPSDSLWESRDRAGWTLFSIPLARDHNGWSRCGSDAEPKMTNIEKIEIHFDAERGSVLNFADLCLE